MIFAKPHRRAVLKAAAQRQDRLLLAQMREVVWHRDQGRCRCCGVGVTRSGVWVAQRGEVHHLYRRSIVATRYEPMAAVLLCHWCHIRTTGTIGKPRIFPVGTAWFVPEGSATRYINADYVVTFEERPR